MSRIVYVNGNYVPEAEANVSVFDRGFLFADAVYEVTSVFDGALIDFEGHSRRLGRSLAELDLPAPEDMDAIEAMHRELIARNDLREGGIYMQISRGPAERSFAFPETVHPSIVAFSFQMDLSHSETAQRGLRVIAIDDLRWGRRDIKTTQLLYPSMGKMMAKAAGADDAWMVEDGAVTEGTSNNAYIVKDGTIVTRQLGHELLAGITRAAVLRIAKELQMQVEERPFTITEAQAASEAFVTSATSFVTPVVEIDGATIGEGRPGPIAKRLREVYLEEARKVAAAS